MELPRLLAAVSIEEPRLRQRTQIDPMMPGSVVAGQAGRFSGKDGSDTPCTHRRPQLAKARALVTSGPTPAHGLSNHDDVGTPQPAGVSGAGLLPPLALGGRADLMTRRRADIDVGVTLEM